MSPAAAARAALEQHGLLLLQDPRLPSLATLIAGAPVKGSWWGHPAGRDIFRAASFLDDDGDVTTAKLIAGKVTFVHRRLFAALAAAGAERAAWQLAGLPRAAAALLARIDDEGPLEASGPAAKELERRLLAATRQVHTASGAHATELATWQHFRRATSTRAIPAARGRTELEAAAASLGASRSLLPW
ncbi:MAG TPA: hypothetical protein VFU21_03405 [Kofleriaceae bacterium]|nr:hypothetical protein [Kofleriaceae bacterium]